MLIELLGRIRAGRAVLKVHGEKKTFSERVSNLAYILSSLLLEVSAVWTTSINTGRCYLAIPWTVKSVYRVAVGMFVEEFLIMGGSPRANRLSLVKFCLLIFQEF